MKPHCITTRQVAYICSDGTVIPRMPKYIVLFMSLFILLHKILKSTKDSAKSNSSLLLRGPPWISYKVCGQTLIELSGSGLNKQQCSRGMNTYFSSRHLERCIFQEQKTQVKHMVLSECLDYQKLVIRGNMIRLAWIEETIWEKAHSKKDPPKQHFMDICCVYLWHYINKIIT